MEFLIRFLLSSTLECCECIFFVPLSNMYGVPVALVTDLAQHVFFPPSFNKLVSIPAKKEHINLLIMPTRGKLKATEIVIYAKTPSKSNVGICVPRVLLES